MRCGNVIEFPDEVEDVLDYLEAHCTIHELEDGCNKCHHNCNDICNITVAKNVLESIQPGDI